jgi:hypothetical protein
VPPHRKSTKDGIDADLARRKRAVNVIERRKSMRDENLLKKRHTFAAPQMAPGDSIVFGFFPPPLLSRCCQCSVLGLEPVAWQGVTVTDCTTQTAGAGADSNKQP